MQDTMSITPNPPQPQMVDLQALMAHLNRMDAQMHHLHEQLQANAATAIPIAPSPVPLQPPQHQSPHAISMHPYAPPKTPQEHAPSFVFSRLVSKPSQFYGKHGQEVYDWLSELDNLFKTAKTATDEDKLTFAVQCSPPRIDIRF